MGGSNLENNTGNSVTPSQTSISILEINYGHGVETVSNFTGLQLADEDYLYKANEDYRQLLDMIGMKYVYRESEGGHIWRNWRIYLSEFVPMLFR